MTRQTPPSPLSAEIRTDHGRPTLHVVEHDGPETVVELGLELDGRSLGTATRVLRVEERPVEERWVAHHGKSSGTLEARHQELVVHLVDQRDDDAYEWQVVVRVAADGVAFRYRVAELWGHGTLTADLTTLRLPASARAWVLDYQTWYETPRVGADVADLPAGAYGLPMLVRLPGTTMLLAESGIDGRFCGAHIEVGPAGTAGGDRTARFTLADDQVEVMRGDITPWRVLHLGPLERVVESRLVDELAPPADPDLADATWVRPGRAAWSWWSDFYAGAQIETQKHYVDVAADLGFEHVLVDCGWVDDWVPDLVAHASLRGVQIHLWAVWHDLNGPEKIKRLALWRSWGVAGIKVDFMESESKDRYRWYDTILVETARLGLHVNFHGSVLPRGWARTYPQVIGYEAIRGSEYYVFYEGAPLTSSHNVVQPFTRNVVGAMDYTPVALSAKERMTSDGHELALSVVFECGITNFAEGIDVLAENAHVRAWLQELPAVWDETRLLAGDPDTHAVIARRAGDRWFVGAIATGGAREIRVPLDRLSLDGEWVARVVTDDPDGPTSDAGAAGGLVGRDEEVGDELVVDVAAHGGFVALLAPAGSDLRRARPRAWQTAPVVVPAVADLVRTGDRWAASVEVSPGATVRTPPGWHATEGGSTSSGSSRWTVTGPGGVRPGHHAVVAVELPGDGQVPVVAHARLVVPLSAGAHALSDLPFLAFANALGPVERDRSNGGGNPGDGTTMTTARGTHLRGLGVSAPSAVSFHLGAQAERLLALVGIDAETPGAVARVAVRGDGRTLWSAQVRSGEDVALDVDVTDVRTLELVTEHERGGAVVPEDGGGAVPFPGEIHVDWADAQVTVL
ncbi:glycoside hydrolase family 97 catalytic domain-containing protein [Oerskovia turbata]